MTSARLQLNSEQSATGAAPPFEVAPVSRLWLPRLVEIDSQWNPKNWSLQLFERELSNQFASVRGLFVADVLVGYLIAHIVMDEAHIVSFGIDEKWRRHGGGRFLLLDFLRSISLEGVHRVSLDVRASNHAAQRLYLTSGFTVAGVRKRYYSSNGEDAVTMENVTPSLCGSLRDRAAVSVKSENTH